MKPFTGLEPVTSSRNYCVKASSLKHSNRTELQVREQRTIFERMIRFELTTFTTAVVMHGRVVLHPLFILFFPL